MKRTKQRDPSSIFGINADTLEDISLFEVYAEDEATRHHIMWYIVSTEEYIEDIFGPYIRCRGISGISKYIDRIGYNILFGELANGIELFRKG